jgi:acyl-CoA synthetase (AMP-forming)/AMP-acid ligase II
MSRFANADYCGFADLLWQGRSSSHPVANVAGAEKTWEDFVRACAGWRAAFQARPERRFGLFHADTWQFAAALFGAWNAGKVPILPGDTQPATVAALAAEVEAFAGQLPATLGKPALAEAVPSGDLGRVSAFDPASVTLGVMTSGSTGTPVSFPKQLGQLEREVATLESVFGERLGKVRVLGTVSHQHIYGLLFRVLWPLSAGRTFESEQLFFAEEIVAHAERASGVVLVSSPAHLRRLPETLPVPGRLFRAVFSSGGPLDFTGAQACRDRFGCLPIEIFGSSETGGIAYRERTEDAAPWTTMPGVEIAVEAETGLLRVRSPHLADSEWLTTSDRVRKAHLVARRRSRAHRERAGGGGARGARAGRTRRAVRGGGAERRRSRAARARRQDRPESRAQGRRGAARGAHRFAASLPLPGKTSREQPGQGARRRASGAICRKLT